MIAFLCHLLPPSTDLYLVRWPTRAPRRPTIWTDFQPGVLQLLRDLRRADEHTRAQEALHLP